MKELHIRLYKNNKRYYADIVGTDTCADCFERPDSGFPCDLGSNDSRLSRAQQALLELQHGRSIDALKDHAAALFDFVHGPPGSRNALYDFWWQCFRQSQNKHAGGLRTVLHIDTSNAGNVLAAAPWELMCSESQQYLAAMPHAFPVTLVRVYSGRPNSPDALNPVEQEPTCPLRVLIVIGHTAAEDEAIKGSIEALRVDEAVFKLLPWQIDLRVLIQPKRTELIEWCEGWQPHVFHFVGHGTCLGNARSCTPKLLLRQDSSSDDQTVQDEQLDAAELADLFKGQVPRLIVLNACRTGQASGKLEGVDVPQPDACGWQPPAVRDANPPERTA